MHDSLQFLKNYRPNSNLFFLSTLIERVYFFQETIFMYFQEWDNLFKKQLLYGIFYIQIQIYCILKA